MFRAVAFILCCVATPVFVLAQAERPTPEDRSVPLGRTEGAVQITNMGNDDQRGLNADRSQEQQRRPEDERGRLDYGRIEAQQQMNRYADQIKEPDIEFQDFVASSLGYRLPIFGQDLFRNPPSTFAPLDRVPVTPDYLIGPGDELLIRAWGQIEINYRAIVDRNGNIYLPRVGTVSVAGLRFDQLESTLRGAVGRVFRNFDLSVTMGQLRSIQVFVVGQVRRPGVYTVSSLSTLVNALFASGGPLKRGSMRSIQLKRAGQVITTFDLYDLLSNGDKSKDRPLQGGDVIYVPPVGRLVALAGSVNIPGIFELKEHENLGDMLRYAGGATTTASGDHALIERIDDHHVRRADEFALSQDGLNHELQDGDVVRFLHISPRFDGTITLRGNVAVPGRYPFHAGMRVHDLIPDRDFLITPEYWKRQNQLGQNHDGSFMLPEERERLQVASMRSGMDGLGLGNDETTNRSYLPDETTHRADLADETTHRADLADVVGRTEAQRIKEEDLKNQIERSAAEINWEYAVIQRMNPGDLTTHLVPFNLGKAIEGEQDQNVMLQPGDVITVFSQKDMQVPIAQRSKFVRLEGEFLAAGVYQVRPGETLRQLIKRVGGFTPQAYLYGAEFTRESTKEAQQKRLDQYNRELEQDVERSASPKALASAGDSAAQRDRVESEKRMLDRMRQLRASGRVVLETQPDSDSLTDFPDLVLEDGDRLLVPFRPATVNVIGSVYNSNSFVFKPGETVSDYLRLSGGATRSGDSKKMFIIRANGETISRQNHSSLIGEGFNHTRMFPGDTIVVPEKIDPGAGMRGIKDWSQVIGQFGIAAAGAGVLF